MKSLLIIASLISLASLSACATYDTTLKNPQTGATSQCHHQGIGIYMFFAEAANKECIEAAKANGYSTPASK